MNMATLHKTIARSAAACLNILQARGQTVTPLRLRARPFMTKGIVYLPLQQRIKSDSAELALNDPNGEIIGYDVKANCVKVRLNGEPTPRRMEELAAYSDVSFLVKRLQAWAQEHDIGFPPQTPPANGACIPCLQGLSEEQLAAVEGILSTPLSYTWGTPGAGKTTYVLAECVLRYIRQGRRALLVAPTNSALERALIALLPVLERHKCSRTTLLRLGIPTENFAKRYPQLCRSMDQGSMPRLLAVTADSFIHYYDAIRRFDPAQVFLDECSYCPLVKALPLAALGKPVAMLGDHMQLLPVCTLEEKDIQREPILCLWQLSAAHMDNLLAAENMEELAKADMPDFSRLPRFDLGASYRFGGKLAETLSERVYQGILHGAGGAGTNITVLHAPGSSGRTSTAEAEAIRQYIDSGCDADRAVLTPYRKQVSLLNEALDYKEEVMTIHMAQGKEWDTVLLSVVDGDNMFFTDTRNSRGLRVINTAVSRARKNLVLVCDAEKWAARPEQLLGRLVLDAAALPQAA